MKRIYQAVSIDYESKQYTGTYYVESGMMNVLYLDSKKSSHLEVVPKIRTV